MIGRWVKDVGGVALYDLGPRFVPRLSRSQLIGLAEALGDVIWRASPADAAQMREELEATLGDAPLEEPAEVIVRRAFQLRLFNELEVLRYPSLHARNLGETVFLEGREHLDEALSHGKGAIVMIGHFGANQMIMPALGHLGYAMNQLSAPPTAWGEIRVDGRANPLWRRIQERRWALEQTLPARHIDVFGFLRPAYHCLARNEVLGLAFDGGGGSRWIPMPLGRRTAWVSTQPWQLARSTGARVVPCVVTRTSRQRLHRVELAKGFVVQRTADRDVDVQRAADAYGGWFTRQLRRRPDHYLPYLLLRRRVRDGDQRPFFDDYPEADVDDRVRG